MIVRLTQGSRNTNSGSATFIYQGTVRRLLLLFTENKGWFLYFSFRPHENSSFVWTPRCCTTLTLINSMHTYNCTFNICTFYSCRLYKGNGLNANPFAIQELAFHSENTHFIYFFPFNASSQFQIDWAAGCQQIDTIWIWMLMKIKSIRWARFPFLSILRVYGVNMVIYIVPYIDGSLFFLFGWLLPVVEWDGFSGPFLSVF